MRLSEILNEKPVQSSWITDLVYSRPTKTLTMRLSNGKRFSIPGVTRGTFEQWINAPSKGNFFHVRIKNRYQINRIQ